MPKKLISIARYIGRTVAGTLLMMWGVMNFSIQFVAWQNRAETTIGQATQLADAGWSYAWMMAAVCSVLPFAAGALICRSMLLRSPSAD